MAETTANKRYRSLVHNKKIILTEQLPAGFSPYEKPNLEMFNSIFNNFISNYRQRLSTVWIPDESVLKIDPPLSIRPSEIYHRHVGQIPNYTGHIPGAIFRYGKTYGYDTIDAKRWLRQNFSF